MSENERIVKAIEAFHDKFYPEIKVRFLGSSKDGKLAFFFSGSFCLTCGLQDYFQDFADILSESMDEEYVVEDSLSLGRGYFGWVVVYAPKRIVKRKLKRVKFEIIDPKTLEVEKVIEI